MHAYRLVDVCVCVCLCVVYNAYTYNVTKHPKQTNERKKIVRHRARVYYHCILTRPVSIAPTPRAARNLLLSLSLSLSLALSLSLSLYAYIYTALARYWSAQQEARPRYTALALRQRLWSEQWGWWYSGGTAHPPGISHSLSLLRRLRFHSARVAHMAQFFADAAAVDGVGFCFFIFRDIYVRMVGSGAWF